MFASRFPIAWSTSDSQTSPRCNRSKSSKSKGNLANHGGGGSWWLTSSGFTSWDLNPEFSPNKFQKDARKKQDFVHQNYRGTGLLWKKDEKWTYEPSKQRLFDLCRKAYGIILCSVFLGFWKLSLVGFPINQPVFSFNIHRPIALPSGPGR